MSASIDERVVEMKFDNAEFERGAKNSINTLKDLDKNLQFENGVKGFAAITDAASKVSFGALTAGIESVGHSFSAMEIAAITVISRITNSLMDAAKNVSNQLLLEPIKTGMSEYEQKMDMVQTTVINSGKSLEEVNETLDQLNHYADKTIFKFSDMTNALSKFTMSGITDLGLAETMIEGIGNIAGESGLKTEQASSAFYMISQAMSAGKMSLYQWRTLENTGFASMKFKQNLLETAAALGKIKKDANGAYYTFKENGERLDISAENLRNTLTETGWMDSEVMQTIFARYASAEASIALGFDDISEGAYHAAQDVKTFSQMWDTLKEAAQSGWTESWQTIIGDYEQAKTLWTGVNNVISGILDKQAEQRNTILEEWSAAGGRDYAIEAVSKAWTKLTRVLDALKRAWNEVFPAMTGLKLERLTYKVVMFARAIEWGSKAADSSKITYVFKSLFEIVKTLYDNVKKVFDAVREAFREFFPKGQSLFKMFDSNVKRIHTFLLSLNKALSINEDTLDKIKRTAKGFFAVISIGVELAKAIYNNFMPIIKKLLPKASDGILGATASLGDLLVSVRDWIVENDTFNKILSSLVGGFTKLHDILKSVASFIVRIFKPSWDILKDSIKDAFAKNKDSDFNFFHKLVDILNAGIAGVGKALSIFLPLIGKVISIIGNIVKGMTIGLVDFIDTASSNGLGNAITSLTVGFGSMLSIFTGWKVFDFFGDIGAVFKALGNGIKSMVDVIGGLEELKDAALINIISKSIKELAISIAIMAASFILLSMCDLGKVGTAFAIMTGGIAELIMILKSVTVLSKGAEELAFTRRSPIQVMAQALVTMASSVLIMAIALSMLAKVDSVNLESGILGMTAIMGELIGAGIILGKKEGDIRKMAKSFIKIGVALVIISFALKMLSKLDIVGMWSGVGAIASLLIILGIFSKLLSKKGSKNFDRVAKSMVSVAISMVIFAKAIEMLGNLDANVALGGIITIMALLLVIDIFAKVLAKQCSSIVYAGVAMIAIAASMVVFAAAIKLIGNIPVGQVIAGVGAISALILVLALASKLVKPLKLITLSVAIVAISASMLVFAAAMKILSTIPFDVLIPDILIVLVTLLALAGISVLLTPFLGVMLSLAGVFAVFSLSMLAVGVGITLLSIGLTALGLAITTFGAGFVAFIAEILSLIPIFFEMLGAGLVAFIAMLVSMKVELVNGSAAIAGAIIEGITSKVDKLFELVRVVVLGICDLINELAPVVIDTVVNLIFEILNAVADNASRFVEVMMEIGTQLIVGLINGMKAAISAAIDAVMEIGSKVVDAAKSVFGVHSPSRVFRGIGEYIDEGLANGITGMAGMVVGSVTDLGDDTIDALKGTIGHIADVISDDSDYNPTITPVLDLSNVEAGTNQLGKLLSNQNGGSLTATIAGRVSSISGKVATATTSGKSTVVNNHYDMTQNNYSPKALSRIELYRQTNNQFERLKGVVSGA